MVSKYNFSSIILLIVLNYLALVTLLAGAKDDGSTVRIPHLGAIRGKTARTAASFPSFPRDFLSFTGIPYGSIPARFSPAVLREPLTSSEGVVFDATQPQEACWQQPLPPIVPGPFTEDCLSLNIFTPKGYKSQSLPVIFFIHGGSFIRWSGNMFDGRRLLEKDVVLVTINYRLNIFGFFCLENDAAPGNLGLYDQILALQWVNKYISYFGGDPNRVTIAGQSAGAASVTYLMDSPLTTNLFHGAISSSGDDLAGWTEQANPLGNSLTAATVLQCYNPNSTTHDMTATLACLRALPASVLVQGNAAFYSAPNVQDYALSIPKVTPVSPYVSLKTTGLNSTIPLIIGSNKNDGSFLLSRIYSSFLVPYGLTNNAEYFKHQFVPALLTSTSFGMVDAPLGIIDSLTNEYLGSSKTSGTFGQMAPGLIDIFSVFYFKSPAYATAKAHSTSVATYLYSFDYYGTQTVYPYLGGVPQVPRGVTHADDLMYLFYFGDFTKFEDQQMSRKMVDFWFNFAKTGNPNGSGNNWPKFTADNGSFLRINTFSSTGNDFVDYWVGASKNIK